MHVSTLLPGILLGTLYCFVIGFVVVAVVVVVAAAALAVSVLGAVFQGIPSSSRTSTVRRGGVKHPAAKTGRIATFVTCGMNSFHSPYF